MGRLEPRAHGEAPAVAGHSAGARAAFGLAQAPGGAGAALADGDEGEEPGDGDAVPAVTSEPLAMPATLLRPDWAEDPLLDCSLEIRCARAVDGVSVIEAAAPLGHADWKLPVHFVVWDGRHQQWVLPDRFGYYTDALASIQLADRRACLDEAELRRFVQMVQQLAQDLGADVDAPDPARLLAQARDLDRLCARFDVRIGVTLDAAGAAWTGPQLRNAAQEAGFVATGPQRWVRRVELDGAGEDGARAAGAVDLYSLHLDPARMSRLTLELDVAVPPVAAHAFRAMVDSARSLGQALDARVVDDNGHPIEAKSVAAIERQLEQVFAEMRAAGIEPGSTRARRLYS
jgi:hypothetical protein